MDNSGSKEQFDETSLKEYMNLHRRYIEKHVKFCKRTGEATEERIANVFDYPRNNVSLIMATMGMNTELAEITDIIQKKVFYGIPIKPEDILEEMGDFLYYWDLLQSELRNSLGCNSLNDITARELNRKKLLIRYPSGHYSNEESLNRDSSKEKEVFKKATGCCAEKSDTK